VIAVSLEASTPLTSPARTRLGQLRVPGQEGAVETDSGELCPRSAVFAQRDDGVRSFRQAQAATAASSRSASGTPGRPIGEGDAGHLEQLRMSRVERHAQIVAVRVQ
jgi:hypothetical protein